MSTNNLIRILTFAALFTGAVQAGPALSCHWKAIPGTAFGELSSLRDRVVYADDSPVQGNAARAELAKLREAIRPGDALSLLRAGFFSASLHEVGAVKDTDGPALILKALELRPNDPEFEFFAALAHLHTDKAVFAKHWSRARELAKPGSAAAENIRIVEDLYRGIVD